MRKEKKVNTLGYLEGEIGCLRQEIGRIEDEIRELQAFYDETVRAHEEVEQQLNRKRSVAWKYQELSIHTTLGPRLAARVEECYGGRNRYELLRQFEDVSRAIAQAIQRAEYAIEERKHQISSLHRRIEQIREEERRRAEEVRLAEAARRAEEARQAEAARRAEEARQAEALRQAEACWMVASAGQHKGR